jgi:mannose/cellobiose epimerase-like protein (N-acyl-D-glucosamine 2-epimerase family)
VQAESFAAAWRLFKATNEARYLQDYERIWRWSWDYMVDHEYGAWFRTKNRDGSVIDDKKSPLGKTDYHTLGACWDVLSTIKNPNASLLDTHI